MERSTILLVDDNAQILGILADLLRPLGYNLFSASDGAEALRLAEEIRPDLILLDVMMPGMDGFTVCQRLRGDSQLAQVPVIMITALDDRASRLRGFEAGADDFIAKPFDYVELRARVASILRINSYRLLIAEQARLAAEKARFSWLVEQSDDGILIIGADDQVRYANPHARTLLTLGVGALGQISFIDLAQRHYHLAPISAWQDWPASVDNAEPRYLVRPETTTAREFWLQADLLPAPPGGDDSQVVRLRDVTAQITSERDTWTFHAMVAHKLRTPLVSIIGGLSILNDGAQTISRENLARVADVALSGARRLKDEIEDVLNYVRPPADPIGTDICRVKEIPPLIATIASDLGLSDLQTRLESDAGEARIGMAGHSIEVILRELLENARKFHPTGSPQVVVELQAPAGTSLSMSVCDNGRSLSPEQLAAAWRPYYQGERNFTGQVEGMGLGLALVSRLLLSVGGSYRIANREDGPGVIVEVAIPLAPSPGAGLYSR